MTPAEKLAAFFQRLNYPQALVVIAFFGLVAFAISQMPAEIWPKIPGIVYALIGLAGAAVPASAALGKMMHPTPEKARAEAIAVLSTPPGPPTPLTDEETALLPDQVVVRTREHDDDETPTGRDT